MKRVRTLEQKRRDRQVQFEKARKLYKLLLRIVGGPLPTCAICGVTERDRPMQLDHKNGKNWRAKDLRMDARVKRYRDELKAGVKFRVLCIDCNAKDGRARQIEGRVHAVDDVPWDNEGVAQNTRAMLRDDILFDGDKELF